MSMSTNRAAALKLAIWKPGEINAFSGLFINLLVNALKKVHAK